MVRICWLS